MAPRGFIGSLPVVPLADLSAREQECSICLCAFNSNNSTEQPRRLPCTHIFGSECLAVWLSDHHTCPLCRAVLFPQERRVPSVPFAFNDEILRDLNTEELVFNMRGFLQRNPPLDREFRSVPNWPEGTLMLERIPTGVRAMVYT